MSVASQQSSVSGIMEERSVQTMENGKEGAEERGGKIDFRLGRHFATQRQRGNWIVCQLSLVSDIRRLKPTRFRAVNRDKWTVISKDYC